MPVTFATATDVGRLRQVNEDALVARPPVFMVADGMGGAEAGEIAAAAAARAFEWFMPQADDLPKELTNLIQKVNAGIYEMATEQLGRPGMGTTLTAAVSKAGSVVIGHVGDSRAYLWRGGRLRQLTEDHSLVGEMVRQGQISASEAEHHPQRSIITRALGVEPTVEVDTVEVRLEPGDAFLLCSDGLYSMVGDEQIAGILARGDDLDVTARVLVQEANVQGGLDNISLVLFCPDGSIPGGAAQPDAETGVISIPQEAVAGDGPAGAQARAGRTGRLERWHLGWLFHTLPGQILLGLLIPAVILAGAWLGTRHVYFLGVEDGHVTIYRGVPYSIGPWNLYSVNWKSPVNIGDLQSYEQDRVAQQELHSYNGAMQIVNNYTAELRERQKAAQQQQSQTSTGPPPATPPNSGSAP